MFRDEIRIDVRAGRGGDGLVSFRREKSMPKGGPDGGDGGLGGSVILRASAQENSLLKLGRRKHYVADNGRPGGPSNKSGKSGEDLILDVPIGTQVFDAEHHNLLYDLATDPSEATDVAKTNPEVVERLCALADRERAELGDKLTKVEGSANRAPGFVPKPGTEVKK